MLISKIKNVIAVTIMLIVVSIFTVNAYAESIEIDRVGDDTIRISGDSQSEYVAINIYAPGKGYADIHQAADKMLVIVYHDQLPVGEDNKFSVDVDLTETGEHSLYYTGESAVAKRITFQFSNIKKLVLALETNLKDTSKTDIEKIALVKTFLNDAALEFDKKTYNASDDDIAEYFYNSIIETPLSESTDCIKTIFKIYNRAVGVSAMKNGSSVNVFAEPLYFSIDETDVAEQYKRDCVSTVVQNAASKRIAEANVLKESEFETAVRNSLILAVVENPDGVGNAKEIIDDFADVIGITPETSITRYEKNVSGKSFTDLTALKTAYNQTISDGGSGNSSVSGNSSSNRGGKGTPSIAVPTPVAPTTPTPVLTEIYSDLDSAAWAKKYIVGLTEMGIVNGKAEGLFCPNDNITREEFTKLITESFLKDAQSGELGFSDVNKASWCYSYIAKAYASGVIKGKSNDKFGIGELITREDMAVIACRAAGLEFNGETVLFTDSDEISAYAKEAVAILNDIGILTGSDGAFMPKATATRAQAAKVIYMLIELGQN